MNFRPNSKKAGFTLVEIMIVVLIIGILLAIAIPNFVAARESSRAKACAGNLKQIDSATQQYAMDKKYGAATYAANLPTLNSAANTGLVTAAGAAGAGYLRAIPVCPENGAYSVAPQITDSPYCAISGQASNVVVVAPGTAGADYAAGGKFYHGL